MLRNYFFQVTVGTMAGDQIMFDKPKPPAVLHEAIYTKVQPFGVLDAVLQQELILYCGKLVATNKELFAGILNIRLGLVTITLCQISFFTL